MQDLYNGILTLESISKIMGKGSEIVWGVADISYSQFSENYSRAIVLVEKYNGYISNQEYDESKYHQIIDEAKANIEDKVMLVKQLMDKHCIRNYIPPLAQTDEESLVAPFSFKYAAVQAGLGWIGKSGVLVTHEFGPRVRLSAIFIDYPLEHGSPITESLCGSCSKCVEACPWDAIKGNNWTISTKREELLDYHLCNRKRSEYIVNSGRKHTCGYCILACPWGMRK